MPAVVLADMHMPGKSGLQMQAQLQSLEPRLPLVFISGGVSAAEMEQAMQQGAVGFLLKPFTRKELCEVLDRALMPPLA
jgi:FixJ family two-component response regulator